MSSARLAPTVEPIVRPFMPELDVVRGTAILLVLLYHGFSWSNGWAGLHGMARWFVIATDGGWTGVNLFFVLSGFLITGILLNSRESQHYFRNFYVRRALRILPLYFATLIVLAVTRQASAGFLLCSFFYISNLSWIFGVPPYYGLLWSLAVEEQFYLLWPAVVSRISTRAVLLTGVTIVALSPLLRAWTFAAGHPERLHTATWLIADGLALGALIAAFVRMPYCSRRKLATVAWALIAASLLLVGLGFRHGITTRSTLLGAAFQESIVNWMWAGLFIFVLLIGTSRLKPVVHFRPLRFLGEISYGLYLLHLFAFDIYDHLIAPRFPLLVNRSGNMALISFRFFASCSIAIAIAFASRRLFEERFLRMKSAFAPQPAPTTTTLEEAPAQAAIA